MRGIALAFAGLAYLSYKAEYLALDTSDALKAFIISPGAILLVLAVIVAFPDPRRRIAGASLALGLVGLLWLAREPIGGGGWTFYTPYSSFTGRALPPYLKEPSPLLAAATALLSLLGLAFFSRRSIPGAILLSASLWCALCFAPSRWITGIGATRHQDYYYDSFEIRTRPSEWDRSDAVLPLLLGLAGTLLLVRPTKEEGLGESLQGPPD